VRVCPFLLSILIFCSCLADQKISQGKFFRLLKIQPNEQETRKFGGLRTLSKIYSAHFQGLEKLELVECGISDLQPLSYLPDLKWLRLSHNPVSDLAPIAGLNKLQVI